MMKAPKRLPETYNEYIYFKAYFVSRMSPLVLKKIAASGYAPEEAVSGYMIQQMTRNDDIEEQMVFEYECEVTGRTLPRFVHLEFSDDGHDVVDIIL